MNGSQFAYQRVIYKRTDLLFLTWNYFACVIKYLRNIFEPNLSAKNLLSFLVMGFFLKIFTKMGVQLMKQPRNIIVQTCAKFRWGFVSNYSYRSLPHELDFDIRSSKI